jgi:BMFP domain-containing protein YqiC
MHNYGALGWERCTKKVRIRQAALHATMVWSMVTGMMDPKVIDDLARRLSNAVPAGLREAQQDIEKNFRTLLQNSLAKLDLVTREEFDVQTRVLARTRERLEALERAIAELEAGRSED